LVLKIDHDNIVSDFIFNKSILQPLLYPTGIDFVGQSNNIQVVLNFWLGDAIGRGREVSRMLSLWILNPWAALTNQL
jgi:hypothetical protein